MVRDRRLHAYASPQAASQALRRSIMTPPNFEAIAANFLSRYGKGGGDWIGREAPLLAKLLLDAYEGGHDDASAVESVGPCGSELVGIPGQLQTCKLRHGHAGQHEAESGATWSAWPARACALCGGTEDLLAS